MTERPARPRLLWIDLARTGALAAMVAYHVVYDVDLILPGAGPDPFRGFWGALPPFIASTFLLLAGITAVLAGGGTPRAGRRARRLLLLGGAATAVSVATAVAMPDRWVRFGILHLMFVCALLTPLLRRVPSQALTVLAVALVVAGRELDHLPGSWLLIPLGGRPPGFTTVDYWPAVPWAAAYITGMLAGRAVAWHRSRRPIHPSPRPRIRAQLARLSSPGRHSLLVYLAHQPVLVAVIWTMTLAAGRRPDWP